MTQYVVQITPLVTPQQVVVTTGSDISVVFEPSPVQAVTVVEQVVRETDGVQTYIGSTEPVDDGPYIWWDTSQAALTLWIKDGQ